MMKKLILFLILTLLVSSCSPPLKPEEFYLEMPEDALVKTSEEAEIQPEDTPAENSGAEAEGTPDEYTVPEEIDYHAVRPYEVGKIMIIMYHGIEDADTASDKYQRTANEFKNDLQTLYDEGFYLISMRDYVNNDIKVKAGKSPVILTFDDGLSSSFSLIDDNGKLVPRQNCAVDILNEFCAKHADFGKAAVFFINKNPFRGEGTLKDALEYLVENGYEIGNHTLNHTDLSTLTAEEITAEVGAVEKLIQDSLPGYETCALSYPYGIRPKEELREFVLNGTYEGITYSYKAALREGQSSSPSAPNRTGFDPTNIPRVRGSDNEETDLGWCLRSFRENPDLKYISDGDPNRISVPEEYKENINYESTADKELFIYER